MSMELVYDLNKISLEIEESKSYWKRFFEKDDFKLGVIYLKPGQEDTQEPHEDDEVYFIIEGDGYLEINGIDYPISPRIAMYVPRNTPHHFHSNTIPILTYYAFN